MTVSNLSPRAVSPAGGGFGSVLTSWTERNAPPTRADARERWVRLGSDVADRAQPTGTGRASRRATPGGAS